jgi:transposase-like protein
MYCKKCKVKMQEQKRSFHKKRKWICPICGRARMEMTNKPGGKKKSSGYDE